MKEKLYGAFGLFGYVIFYFIAAFCTFAPLIFLSFPFWLNLVLVMCVLALPLIGTLVQCVLWILSFPVVLAGKIEMWAIAYFIACALFVFTILLPTVLSLFHRDT